jgi:hypothetical protein
MKRIIFLTFFLFIFQNVQAENLRLSEAYENELINRVRLILSPQPSRMKTIEDRLKTPVCATSTFLEAVMVKDRLSPKARAMLETLLARPKYDPYPEYTFDSPAGHFKIHYTTLGTDAVYAPGVDVNPYDGVPDYVNRCAEFFDHVWTYELDTLGYKEPPSDYFYPDSNGGDGKYDVYLEAMEFFGYTVPESRSTPNFPSYTSYIGMLSDFSEWAFLHPDSLDLPRVTAAHEFFHAIQCGYDATEAEPVGVTTKPYWMEMSAVWMEDMVYDNVNDYIYYLPSFFNHPEWSLKTFGVSGDVALHPYGSCVWPIYLSEKFGRNIIKEIWEKCAEVAGDNVIEPSSDGKSATDKVLEARGSNFEDAFREFTVWNYFTADRARPNSFYSEGDQFYPFGIPVKVKVDTVHIKYPVNVTSIPHHPENLGSNYVVFKPDTSLREGGIKIDFMGRSGEYEVSAVGYRPYPLDPFDTTFLINPVTQTGTGKVYNWSFYTEVLMIPAVITRSPNYSFIYEYSADYDSSLHGDWLLPQNDEILQNYPNPFVIKEESDRTYFPFVLSLPSRVRIDILTLSGERIKTIIPKHDPEFPNGEYLNKNLAMPWDGRTEKGEYVAPGIYLYRFKTDRTTAIKKMAVIR